MKSKFTNKVELAGYLYQHKLENKVTGPNSKAPNTPYIGGTIDIATDADCTNIITVQFPYVTATTSKGGENYTYNVLANIINGVYKTVMGAGKEEATKLRCDTALALNEYYTDKSGELKFVSVKINKGGFLHVDDSLFTEKDMNEHNKITCDMVITGFRRIEANEEKNLPEKGIIKGCIFDYAKAVLPVEFAVYDASGLDFYENAEISSSNPLFTEVRGQQICQSIVRRVEEASAFGAPSVRTFTSNRKEFVVDSMTDKEFPWDDPTTITAEELTKAMQDRELVMAGYKKKFDENKATKAAVTAPPTGKFDFGGF